MAMQTPAEAGMTLPQDGWSRWEQLRAFVPLCRESVRQRELAGRFPRRKYLTKRCAVWPNREMHVWFADPVNYRSEAV